MSECTQCINLELGYRWDKDACKAGCFIKLNSYCRLHTSVFSLCSGYIKLQEDDTFEYYYSFRG